MARVSKRASFGDDEPEQRRDARASGPGTSGAQSGSRATSRDRGHRAGAARGAAGAHAHGSARENIVIVQQLHEAYNKRKPGLGAELVSDSVQCVCIPLGATVCGRDGYQLFMQGWTTAFPDSRTEIEEIVAAGDAVAVEFTASGTHEGPFLSPDGTIPATGRRVEISGCQVVHIEHGKVTDARIFFDSLMLMRQLGLVPEGPSGKVRWGHARST